MAFCQNCGTNLGDGRFCPSCGTPAFEAAPAAPVCAEPAAPVYAEPAAPVYAEPAAPVYAEPAAPVYAEPAAPVYAEPAAPVYAEPAAPVYAEPAAPVYAEPAAPVYAPTYQSPVNYVMPTGQPPVAPPPPVKKSGKAWLFVGLGVALVAIIAAILFLFVFKDGNDAVGTYELTSMDMNGQSIDASMLELFGMEITMVLREDGSGEMNMYGEALPLTWDNTGITIGGDTAEYTLDGEILTIYDESSGTMVFQRIGDVTDAPSNPGTANIPTVPTGPSTDPSLDAFWNQSWYGWWIVDSGSGDYADWGDGTYWWDACADTSLDENNNLTMNLWDEDYERYDTMADVTFTLDPTSGAHGSADSSYGTFLDAVISDNDWQITFDPDYTDLMIIEGYYEEPENADNNFSYTIYLRPWGMTWDDLATEDAEYLPYYYDSWYLPLIQSGVTTAPDEIDAD